MAVPYQDKFMDIDLYDDTYDAFCELVATPAAKILEIGCGPGNITRYLLRKRPDFVLTATDVAANMVALAQKNNPTAHCERMDCREIHTLTTVFDALLCGFCMPYLSKTDCEKLIGDSAKLLRPNGIFYASAIEDDYEKSKFETSSDGQHTMFIYYHTADDLQAAFTANGFEIVYVQRKKYPKGDGSVATHLIMMAKKM